MKQLPDDLFRRRLGNHKLTPPPSAWSRIEKNLPGSRKATWMKVAAAVLLLLAAPALIWSLREENNEPAIAEQQSAPDNDPAQRIDRNPNTNETQSTPAEVPSMPKETPNAEPSGPPADAVKNEPLPDHSAERITENIAMDSGAGEQVEVAVDLNSADSLLSSSVAATEPVPFKLVLEADEVQAKYLRKKSVADATQGDAKASGLKKLLDKANDISNQDPIGDLRQMKNDIFALNFQGKKRDQNK